MLREINNYSNKISFNSYVDFETYPVAEVCCPNCKRTTNINLSDLRKHEFSEFTNLTNMDNELLARKTLDSLSESMNSFLDYYCPNCKTGIRILYESWAGGKHEEHGFELKYILTTHG